MPTISTIGVLHADHVNRLRLERHTRERRTARLLSILAILTALGLAALTVMLGLAAWKDVRSDDGMITIARLTALVILLSLAPFLVLGVSALLSSPVNAYHAAHGLIRQATHRPRLTILVLAAFTFMTALASTTGFILMRLIGEWAGVTIGW
jgi:hypothetical protein